MHKRLIILGLLVAGPLSGYRLHQVAAAHGELYSDLKKPNLYYLLGRMAEEGLLEVRAEAGARGPRRERLVYSLTDAGRRELLDLLRREVREYEPARLGIEAAAVLLDHLPRSEAAELLRERRRAVSAHRRQAADSLGPAEAGSAADHVLMLVDAELAWLDRALARCGQAR
jgi:DNA-binding PadR family transcriptional regulator